MGNEEAMKRALVLILLTVLGRPAPAASQPHQRGPRVEAGVDGGVFTAFAGDGVFPVVALGPRLSLNLTDRIGLDLIADMVAPHDSGGLYGLYGIQARRLIREDDSTRGAIFITGGAVGGFEYQRIHERRTERPDGSVVVYRAYTRGSMSSPLMFSGGIGMQRALTRFAAFRAEGQFIFGFQGAFLVRGTLGLSVPMGGTYARTH